MKSRIDGLMFYFVLALMFWAACLMVAEAKGQGTTDQYRAICQINTSEGQGSGTLIGTRPDLGVGLVLSCRHVCQYRGNPLDYTWIWAGGEVTPGYTLVVIPGKDFDSDKALAITRLPKGINAIPVVPFDIHNGPFVMAGYRDGVLRVAGPVDDVNVGGTGCLTIHAPLIKGQSGGPMLDARGSVVGVVVASDEQQWGMSSDGPQLTYFINQFMAMPTVSTLKLKTGK